MKIKPHLKVIPIITIFFLTLLACETEPFGGADIVQLTLQEEFQANFSLDNFADESGHIIQNIEINWEKFKTRTYDGKEWYEFSVEQRKPISYSGKGEIQGQYFTLLAHKNEEGIKYLVNKMLSFSKGEGFTYFNIEEKYYHGMVYLFNLQGEAEHLFHFEKGKPMHAIESIKVETSMVDNLGLIAKVGCWEKANTARCDSALQCALDGGANGGSGDDSGSCGGGGSGWTAVTTHHYTDWYNNNGDSWSYNGTTYDGSTTEWVWIPGDGYSGSDISWSYAESSGNGPNLDGYASGEVNYLDGPPKNTESKTFEFLIDNSIKENDCAKSIIKKLAGGDYTKLRLNNLGELETSGHLSSSILKLFKDNDNWNLTIKVGEAGTNRNAFTQCTGGDCTITIDDDYFRMGTTLALARTITHESVHAYLKYLLKEYRTSETSSLLNQYYQDYARNEGMAQHEVMTQYVDAMAYSLGVWDNFSKDMDYYKYLAWSGDMQNTNAFNSLSDELKNNIRNANHAEGSAIHSSTRSAKGTRCNN